MPITKSARKALRQNIKRKARNIEKRKKIKNLFKEVESLILQKKIPEAKAMLPNIYKTLDKAAKIGLIKKNTASRKKSRIVRHISSKA